MFVCPPTKSVSSFLSQSCQQSPNHNNNQKNRNNSYNQYLSFPAKHVNLLFLPAKSGCRSFLQFRKYSPRFLFGTHCVISFILCQEAPKIKEFLRLFMILKQSPLRTAVVRQVPLAGLYINLPESIPHSEDFGRDTGRGRG